MKGGETSFTGSELGCTEPAGQCTYVENMCVKLLTHKTVKGDSLLSESSGFQRRPLH